MLTKKELQIIELFRKNIFSDFTILEIMKRLGTKSYSWTYNSIKKLQKEDIILIERKGQSQLCRINLHNQKTIAYLGLLEELNALEKNIPNFKKISELMPLDFHILIITGSYVDKKFNKESDLDVVVIIDSENEKKWILNKLKNEGDLMIPQLHPYVFTRKEFLEMLTNKEENYGKEIDKKHLILGGAELFFKILREAISYGYKR